MTYTLDAVLKAKSPEDLFGVLDASVSPDLPGKLITLKARRTMYAKHTHPDAGGTAAAFAKVLDFYTQAKLALEHGTYGQKHSVTITTKRDVYTLFDPDGRLHSDIADIYKASSGTHSSLYAKVGRNPKNNDLMMAEANNLRFLREKSPSKDMPIMCHIAELIEATEIKDGPVTRKVNIFPGLQGGFSLRQIRDFYPNGIDPRDAAWMFNRLLAALMATHNAGIVHGAVLPENFIVFPKDHGGVLINWEHSVKVGEPLKTFSKPYFDWYPWDTTKVPNQTDFGVDIHMAAGCMAYLLGSHPHSQGFSPNLNPRIAGLLRACWLAKGMRLTDAKEVYGDFSEILKEAYGPRKFREFHIPATAGK